jgi:prophage antirepressor-like protein
MLVPTPTAPTGTPEPASLLRERHFPGNPQPLRSVLVKGEPWFVAKDVCSILGLSNPSQALRALDADEKGVTSTDTLGGAQEVLTVSESGLYALVMRSRKPEAKAFRKWVTSVVLPAIRRDGGYIRGEELLQVDGLSLRALEAREVLLESALAAVMAKKRQRLDRLEEREGRASGFRALKRRLW